MMDIAVVVSMRSQGKTYQQIGDHLGVSKQAVHSAFKRYLEQPKQFRQSTFDWIAFEKEKIRYISKYEKMYGRND